MKKVICLLLVTAFLPGMACAFVELQGLEPNPAQPGQNVSLLVRVGECDEVEDAPIVTIDGQEIDVLVPGHRVPSNFICFFPIIDHDFSLGAFPPGDYTVTVRYDSIVGGTETVGQVSLSVVVPRPIPAGNWPGFLLLVVLMLVLGGMAIRTRGSTCLMFFLLVLAFPPDVLAQPGERPLQLHILLAHGSEVPAPSEIIENWDISPPPVSSLSTGDPAAAQYLLRLRAEGDFRALLDANPDTPRARLERIIVVEYSSETDRDAARAALGNDPNIEAVSRPTSFELSFSGSPGDGGANYGWPAMNIGDAWQWAGGHALIGVVDTGLATQHSELRAFTPSGSFTWGNFLPAYSLDVGRYPTVDAEVDERKLEPVDGPVQWCDTDAQGMGRIESVGHGTHVAGLIGANAYEGSHDVAGVCKHCGIGMWRFAFARCDANTGTIFMDLNFNAVPEAVTFLGDVGAQVINLSLGGNRDGADVCAGPGPGYDTAMCNALDYVSERGIAVVAASGNHRAYVHFPAGDARVVAAGGVDNQFELWDEHPGGVTNCPTSGSDNECGSNWTFTTEAPKQEVVAAARRVFGVVYPGVDHNTTIQCGDSFGPGPDNDGYGTCTGTSMSAPQISGILGILRSVNPLVPVGDPWDSGVEGVRDVLASTTFRAQAGQGWDMKLGWGLPDARAAVRKMLGAVGSETARNRATPLFSFYGSGAWDHAYTTSPQTAIALLTNNSANFAPLGAQVPGYSSFPDDPLLGAGDIPRANVFVMTTEYKTHPHHPDLTPLFLMRRARTFPVGCNPETKGCNTGNRDFLLATGVSELEALHALGYEYRGIEGYVYERCTPEPDCIPEGAQRLWRKCRADRDDCAVFLENERSAFEADGYTAAVPAGFPMHIGYAYPNVDTDSDGLIDGFEHLIGTDPTLFDTDNDGVSDGAEFPMAAVADRDPCDGPRADRCRTNRIFANRFEDREYLGPGMSATMPMSTAQACAEIDSQLTTYEQHLDEQSSLLSESDGEVWQKHLEEVAAVEEVRDTLEEYCDW